MISSTHSPAATDATARSPLMEQLARRVDADRDGQVTSAEFSSFLAGLMQSLDNEQGAATSPASAPTPAAEPVLPAQPAAMTPAQASALLRQAFEPVVRNR